MTFGTYLVSSYLATLLVFLMSPGSTEYAAGLLYQVLLLPPLQVLLLPLLLCLHQMKKTHLVQLPFNLQLMSLSDEQNPLAQLICFLWLLLSNLPQFIADLGTHTVLMALGESG